MLGSAADQVGGAAFDRTYPAPGGGEVSSPVFADARPVLDTSTPVLILGGKENSLSLTRRYGRLGITVRASGPANCWALYSRYCREAFRIPHGAKARKYWERLLLAEGGERLDRHIILPCSDDAIEFVAEHHAALADRHILGSAFPELQLALLDKQRTLELAAAVGVPAPRFWSIASADDLAAIRDSVTFPVMVKPLHSHKFVRVFHQKLFIVEKDFSELAEKIRLATGHGLQVMVVEMIPGPDSLLSSYYTYLDRNGGHLFHFTKRIIRRFPANRGGACYHVTEWLPETAELGRKLFGGIGFRGLGNVEFKRDLRDGKLKVIEVNGRFTAAQELVVQSGAPIDLIVYCDLTGQPPPRFSSYRQELRYWYPLRDFLAFLELRGRGELSFAGWLKSLAPYRHVLPLASLRDPAPVLGAALAVMLQIVRGRA